MEKRKDDSDKVSVVVALKQHDVFKDGGATLKNIITKDVVTPVNQAFLISTEHIGHKQMNVFLDKRPWDPPDSSTYLDLKSLIKNNKTQTFAYLYEGVQRN